MPTLDKQREELDYALTDRLPRIGLWTNYYNGVHRLSFATSKFKEAFGDLFSAFADNWCQLVVDAAVERLEIQGFRFGEDDADDDAWGIWQENGLDARSIVGHEEAVKNETGYLLVGPPKLPGAEPLISVESPYQVVCAHDPADRRVVTAALKKYRDRGRTIEVLYTPDTIATYVLDHMTEHVETLGVWLPTGVGTGWELVSDRANPLGEVPVVPLENNPDLMTGGSSDLQPAVALNDAANKFFTDMLHASEFTSFPQRVATGVELPTDPITGEVANEVEIRAAVSRLWAFEAPDANVTQLEAGSLAAYVEGVDLAVQHLAAQTRTPPHYLLAKLANISGDALIAAEAGLNFRCKRKQIDFSDPWERALRLAFRWRWLDRQGWAGAGDDRVRSEMTDAETIWTDPQRKDPLSLAQSLAMKKQIDVPDEVLWEEAGYTPQQIARMKQIRDERQDAEQNLMDQAPEGAKPAVQITPEGQNLAVAGLAGPAAAGPPGGKPALPPGQQNGSRAGA